MKTTDSSMYVIAYLRSIEIELEFSFVLNNLNNKDDVRSMLCKTTHITFTCRKIVEQGIHISN